MSLESETTEKLRLDKWLWAARICKTRGLAAEAIRGGKVVVDDKRVKPGKEVRVGMQISIRQGSLQQVITVKKLSNRRGPANIAAALYEESQESRQSREELLSGQQEALLGRPKVDRRPNKKERRRARELRYRD
jgi:Ribosome-associated heat shock protein implicated in the recycling of the 50S subunit (S4 paralog)